VKMPNMKDFRPLGEIATKISFCEEKSAKAFSECFDILLSNAPDEVKATPSAADEIVMDKVIMLLHAKVDALSEADRVNFFVINEMMSKMVRCMTLIGVHSMADHGDSAVPDVVAIKLAELARVTKLRDETFSGNTSFFGPENHNPNLN
jgi:hypothetical protein